MRFKWGNMEFSKPSRFLSEIDPRFVQADSDREAQRPDGFGREEGASALDRLRRRFDYRFQQRTGANGASRRAMQSVFSSSPHTDPALVQAPRPSTEGMRRLGVRQKEPDAASAAGVSGDAGADSGGCAYREGDRVAHPRFGEGVVRRIETLPGDCKLVIDFGREGEKTLLARFAKLTKL